VKRKGGAETVPWKKKGRRLLLSLDAWEGEGERVNIGSSPNEKHQLTSPAARKKGPDSPRDMTTVDCKFLAHGKKVQFPGENGPERQTSFVSGTLSRMGGKEAPAYRTILYFWSSPVFCGSE